MRKIINSIPNTITLLNLLGGVVAIIFAFTPLEQIGCLQGWQWCAISIAAAAVFDFLDGFAARLLHAKSAIGAELDSLCDMVSFGVAPAMLVMNTMLAMDGGWASYVALFIPLMGALRLAKFNVDTTQTTEFSGLPIPANAIFWIGAVSILVEQQLHLTRVVMAAIIVCVSLLMVSTLRMTSLKFSNLQFAPNIKRYLLIIGAVVLVSIFRLPGLCYLILFYVLLSLVKINVTVSRSDSPNK